MMIRSSKDSPLDRWERLHDDEAVAQLLTFCASRRWATELISNYRYSGEEALLREAESIWFSLPDSDWLEAFAAHPRIGEKKASTTAYLASSETEQSAAQQTLEPVAEALLKGNSAYEEKFGFRYIVFASGRTAPELLAVLEERLTHTREEELHEAARQQFLITQLRMTKWLRA
jgi:2-oxo-4-hydroxy-4-carboxy-5-ureidoimidazoline decarboxylase